MKLEEITAVSDEIVRKSLEVEKLLSIDCTPKEREIWIKQVKYHIGLYNNVTLNIHLFMDVLPNFRHIVINLIEFNDSFYIFKI